MKFIDSWGTHVVTEVQLGKKSLKRYKLSSKKLTTSLMTQGDNSVKVGGSYGGYSGSLSVDISKVSENDAKTSSENELSETIQLGSIQKPEPIHLTMIPIYNVLEPGFFDARVNSSSNHLSNMEEIPVKTAEIAETARYDDEDAKNSGYEDNNLLQDSNCPNLSKKKDNLRRALEDYPYYKKVNKPADPKLSVPLTWPEGTYGLPKPNSGCPSEGNWNQGSRHYDTEDDDSSNSWSPGNHFAGYYNKNNLRREYCIKPVVEDDDLVWGRGRYCIYMYNNKCPQGFQSGWIYWDDEDDDNGNRRDGMVPTGIYDSNTKIEYCCRTDGSYNKPIFLPTRSPFYLLMGPDSSFCQKVHGMQVYKEWLHWDTEDDDNANRKQGTVPKSDVGRNIKIYYCYYTPM